MRKPHISHISHVGPLNEMERRQVGSNSNDSGKFRVLVRIPEHAIDKKGSPAPNLPNSEPRFIELLLAERKEGLPGPSAESIAEPFSFQLIP